MLFKKQQKIETAVGTDTYIKEEITSNISINASEIITITHKGSITGDIFTGKISIEEGGKFEGK